MFTQPKHIDFCITLIQCCVQTDYLIYSYVNIGERCIITEYFSTLELTNSLKEEPSVKLTNEVLIVTTKRLP